MPARLQIAESGRKALLEVGHQVSRGSPVAFGPVEVLDAPAYSPPETM